MDEIRMRTFVGKRVSVTFDHGIRVIGTLTGDDLESTMPLFGVSAETGTSVAWDGDRRFRASAVIAVDEVR